MMHWEYKLMKIPAKTTGLFVPQMDLREFEHALAELGRVGWELVECKLPSIRGIGNKEGAAILKRPK